MLLYMLQIQNISKDKTEGKKVKEKIIIDGVGEGEMRNRQGASD